MLEFLKGVYNNSHLNSNFHYRSLEPATTYQFRVCAVNSAGASEWSEITEASTPPAAPTAVSGLHLKDSSATSLTLGKETLYLCQVDSTNANLH